MAKPPKIVIPGLNRGAGIPGGYILGRSPRSKQGPAQLLNLIEVVRMGIQTVAGSSQGDADTGSTAASATSSLSASLSTQISTIVSVDVTQSTSLSQISSSLSGAISTNVGQSTSLSQISSSLSGAISSTASLSTAVSTVISGSISSVNSSISSLSTAVSTVISGSISTVNSRIDSLSAAGGGGATTFLALTDTPATYAGAAAKVVRVNAGETGLEFAAGSVDPGQSTSLSQISASLSSEISSRASGDTSLSTVISGSISTVNSSITSLSTAVSTVISSSISTEVSSRSSGDTSLSTVISGSISSANSRIDSLSTAVGSGGGSWALVGGGQTATGTWDQAVDGTKATVDFTGLNSNDIMILARSVTKSVSTPLVLQVSVDNGATFYSTSGDYILTSTAGAESNQTHFGQIIPGNNTAARSGAIIILASNGTGLPKVANLITALNGVHIFVASTSPINAVRILGNGGGNLTGGKIYCLGK